VLLQLALTKTNVSGTAQLRHVLCARSAAHAITRAWACGLLDATIAPARRGREQAAIGPLTAAAVQQHLISHPRPVGELARRLGITRDQTLDLLRTRQPSVGGLVGLHRVIAAYLMAGWTREEVGAELGLAYRGVAHHVVRAREALDDAPHEPSLIHRALLFRALPVPRGLPVPHRAPTADEQLMLNHLATGTHSFRGSRPRTLRSLMEALNARTPTHAIALGWAAGLLGPGSTANQSPRAAPTHHVPHRQQTFSHV
jgi:hypothetical protein